MSRSKTPHSCAPIGQRVRVTLKNGEEFVDKFRESKGARRFFDEHVVRQGDIVTFTIVKGHRP